MFLTEQFDLHKYSMILNDSAEVNKSHLFINVDRAEYCFDLSAEYRHEKLRRDFEKYILNRDALFEWHPQDTLSEVLGCDLTGYSWQFGDPGIWLAGKHLAHFGAVPFKERTTRHLAFRSVREIESLFYAFTDHSFFNTQIKKNYKKVKMMQNKLSDMLRKFEYRLPLI